MPMDLSLVEGTDCSVLGEHCPPLASFPFSFAYRRPAAASRAPFPAGRLCLGLEGMCRCLCEQLPLLFQVLAFPQPFPFSDVSWTAQSSNVRNLVIPPSSELGRPLGVMFSNVSYWL